MSKEMCPIFWKKKQEALSDGSSSTSMEKCRPLCVLKEGDPLFGVLNEEQVGINPNTRRLRMAADVLEGMRQYMLVANGEERKRRESQEINQRGGK